MAIGSAWAEGSFADGSFEEGAWEGGVVLNPPVFSGTVPVITAEIGDAYSVDLDAYFAPDATTYSLEDGSLPSGVTLSGSVISGTFDTAQIGTFQYRGTNADGFDVTNLVEFTITEAADTQAPTLDSAVVANSGTTLSVLMIEDVQIGAGGADDFTITPSGGAATLTFAGVSGAVITYGISRAILPGETLTIGYTQPTDGVQDLAGNELATFASGGVTNLSTYAVPALNAATIRGQSLLLQISKLVTIGAGGSGGVALTASGGALTATYVSTGTTVTYLLSRIPALDETITVSYTQPGDGIEDLAGGDLASFTDEAVTIRSPSIALMPSVTSSVTGPSVRDINSRITD